MFKKNLIVKMSVLAAVAALSLAGWHARVKEAKKLGFTYAIAPKTHKDAFVRGVGDLRQALIDYLQ